MTAQDIIVKLVINDLKWVFLNKILDSVDEKKRGLRKNIKESHDTTLELITQD